MSGELTTRTEPVEPWQPIGCTGCPKPAEWQQTAYQGEERLPVSVGHCGDKGCQTKADEDALEMAPHPTVQRLAGLA